jgi:hypothetical protein
MVCISLGRPLTAVTTLAVILLAVMAFIACRQIARCIWPSERMADRAYGASEECVRQIAMHKDSLLFAGLGLDPGAGSHLRHDGNYESSGWVEQMNDYGHRVHRDWHCVLHYNGKDNWSVIYLEIGKYTQGTYVPD